MIPLTIALFVVTISFAVQHVRTSRLLYKLSLTVQKDTEDLRATVRFLAEKADDQRRRIALLSKELSEARMDLTLLQSKVG